MGLQLQQTDTDLQGASECGVIAACATGTISTETIESRLLTGGTPGTTEQTVALPASSSRLAVFLQSGDGVPGVATWDAGDWIVRFNVTTAQMDVTLDAIWICRVDNVCGTVATIASETGIGADLSGGGVFTRTLTASEHTGTDTDEIYIVVRLTNNFTMSSRTVGITPDQIIDTPILVAKTVALGQAQETDTANDVRPTTIVPIGQASETDAAFAMTAEQSFPFIAFRDSVVDPSDATTYTFSNVNFGPADANRHILVGFTNPDDTFGVSSVTIGGVTATLVVKDTFGEGLHFQYIANVPTGTSGTVEIVFGGSKASCGIAVWSIDNPAGGTTPHDTGVASFAGSPATVSIDVPVGGVIASATGFDTTTISWTNVTSDYYEVVEAGTEQAGAHENYDTVQTGLNVTATYDQSLVFVASSWEQAAGATTVAIGQAQETDAAQTVVAKRATAIGLSAETDAAQALAAFKSQGIGLAAETDVAQALASAKAIVLGLGAETDAPFAVNASKSAGLGLAPETDSAFAFSHSRALSLGLAAEGVTAFDVAAGRTHEIGLASETDVAFSFTSRISIGTAEETDAAFALIPAKSKEIGLALESDTAFALETVGAVSIGQAQETDTSSPMGWARSREIGLAAEADAAFVMGAGKAAGLGLSAESDTAFAMAHSRSVPIDPAETTDEAFALLTPTTITLGLAAETDTAPAMSTGGVGGEGQRGRRWGLWLGIHSTERTP